MTDFIGKISNIFEDTITGVSEEVERYKFSGSNLPYCARRDAYNKLLGPQGKLPTRKLPVKWSFAAEIGTAMHTVIQRSLAQKGILWGNWSCICGGARKAMLGPQICDCGQIMVYQEIKVVDPHTDFRGKVDGILKIEDDFILVDFKTKRADKKLEVDPAHVYQLASYKWFLEKDPHNLKFTKTAIIYLHRDIENENKPPGILTAIIPDLQPFELEFERYRSQASQVKDAIDNRKVMDLPKKCKKMQDAGFCPFANICFNFIEEERRLIGEMYGS